MPLVMLRRDAFSTFRKHIRNSAGIVTKTLEFDPGVVVDLPEDDADAIKDDLYHALFPMRIENGKPVPIDREVFYADFSDSVAVDVSVPVQSEEAVVAGDPINNTPHPGVDQSAPESEAEGANAQNAGRRSRK